MLPAQEWVISCQRLLSKELKSSRNTREKSPPDELLEELELLEDELDDELEDEDELDELLLELLELLDELELPLQLPLTIPPAPY